MSSPEGKIQTPEGRIVLSQDIGQYEQSVQKKRAESARKEQADFDAAQKEYEKDVKAAEAQYQKDLAAYEKQQREAENAQNKYDAEIKRLEAQKQKELADAHYSVWGPDGSRNRSELSSMQRTIEKNYDSKINKQVEQKRIQTGYQDFSIAYPGQVLPANVAKTFRESPSFSLTGLYEQKVESKAARAEYQRQGSIQTAQNIAAKQSVEYHSSIPNIGFISSGLGTERGSAVKPLRDAPEGKKAVETRQRLTNVNTGQSIMGGQQATPEITIISTETYRETPDGPVLVRNVERTIPEKKASKGVPTFANPVAFVASLDRQNVDISGKPIVEKVQPKSNIEILKDTLSRYQALTGEQKAPYKTVLEASLTDKGRRIDPISKLFIEQSVLKQYSTRAEAFGLAEAKGRKGIIKKDGKQVFDLETGMGDVNIGRKLGFVYDYNLQRPTEEKGVLFEGSLQYVVSPKVQGPQQPKFEEAVAFPGTLEDNLRQQLKPSELGAEIQRGFQQLEEESLLLEKTPKSENPLLAAYQYVAPVGIAAGKSIYAGLAFGVNQAEQVQAPFYRNLLGLKPEKLVAPVQVGDASGVTVLPVNFEKLDIRKPETYGSSFQNPLEKEYQQKQLEYIKNYGPTEYFSGLVFDYGGLRGSTSLIRTGIKSTPKLVTKISLPKRQLLTVKGGVTIPSKTWDIVEKIGFRKGVVSPKTKTEFGKVTTQQPVPNPFGKERVIPYNLQKAQTRFRESLQAGRTKAVQIGGKIKTAIQKDFAFPNKSLIEGRNVEIPNITRPAKPEFSKTLESARIGLEMKKQSLAKRLSEMENIYRGGIDTPSPYSRKLESLGIGLRIKRQEFAKGISSVGKKIPELKTPKGIIKIQKGLEKRKKAIIFIGKRTIKGIETRRENIIKSLGKLKPTIKTPYLPQKTSLEIAKFKQKEKLDATLARMRKITTTEEKPKAIVPSLSKNFLSRLKRGGISEPWDFRSIVKPFQRPRLKSEFPSTIRGSPIGKIKGTTSRKEFARMLTETKQRKGIYNLSNISTRAGFGIKKPTVRDLIAEGISKESRISKIRDVKALRFPSQIKTKSGFGRKFPTVKELVKEGEFKQARFVELQKSERFSAPFTRAGFGIKEKSVKELINEGLYKQKRFEQLQKSERFSAPFTKAGFGIKEKSVKDLISEGLSKAERVSRIKNINDLKAPVQTIKPIFPVPRKPTELENILEGFKKEKKIGQPYKQVRIDKYVPKYPKSWEAWRGVGIVTAAGTISALGLGQEKAEALPFASIGKIGARQVESGGQVLLFKESKDFGKISRPILVPPTLKERQEEDEDNVLLARTPSRKVLTVLPKVSFEFSTPQRVQESIKMKVIQPAKISFAQSAPQKTRQREKQKTRQISKTKYETIAITRVTPKLKATQAPKLASPLAPKVPTKLKAPQRQPLREKPVQITLLRTRPPPKPPRVIFALPPDKEKEKKKPRKEEKQVSGIYLGNVPETQISGIFKRKEITLGKEKIEKTRRGDVRVLLGKKRETRKESKWFEGKKGDMFGFKNESRKRKTKFF